MDKSEHQKSIAELEQQIQDQQSEIERLKDSTLQAPTEDCDSGDDDDEAVENNSSNNHQGSGLPSTSTATPPGSSDELAVFRSMFRKAFGLEPEEPAEPERPPEDPLSASIAKSLAGEIDEETLDPTTSAIPQVCVDMLDRWFRNINTGSRIQEILKTVERPSNANSLKIVTINEEVRSKMSRKDMLADQKMKWISNAIIKSASPIAIAWSKLLNLQMHIQKRQNAVGVEGDAMIPIANNEPDLNISEVIRDLQLGLKVLGIASVQSIQKRRLDLRYKLTGAAKELADPSKPFDDNIFGPNLKQHFTSILNVNKITNKMTSNRVKGGNRFHPFLDQSQRGRHRLRGNFGTRGYHNHQGPRQYQQPNHQQQQQYQNQSHSQWSNPSQSYSQQRQGVHSSPRKNPSRGRGKPKQ